MKKLVCYFDERTPNLCFNLIFKSIYEKLKIQYPEYEMEHLQPEISNASTSPGSGNNFQIINPENKKTIALSFADRGMDILSGAFGWEEYNVVQYLGGLGINLSPEEIKRRYNVIYSPYQYPLDKPIAYEWIEQCRIPYDPTKKIRKAIFMGRIHNAREGLMSLMKNHPLVEIIGNDPYYGGKDYFEKLSQYAISLSLNGNGEFCLRDVESMGLGIPMVRSKMLTPFHNPLIPDVHFIPATEPCPDAHCSYRHTPLNIIAEQFIDTIEKNIMDDEKLIEISNNSIEYYNNYQSTEYIINLYLELIDINNLF